MANLAVVSGPPMDPDDAAINALESSYRGLEEMLPRMLAKKGSIDRDGNLGGDHCERLHDAYDSWLSAAGALIELLKDLRASVIGHDLAVERAMDDSESFSSVEGLLESLHGGKSVLP